MKSQMIATVAGGISLTLLQMISGMVLAPMSSALPESPADMLGWLVLSNLLVAGVLAWYARRSAWTGWRLAGALFVTAWGIGTLNSLIEAHFFAIFDRPDVLPAIFVLSLPPVLLFAPLMVWLSGRWSVPGAEAAVAPDRGVVSWMGRFAACSVTYLVLYFTAGMIIFPYVQPFYDQRALPSPSTIILLQLFLRGPIFAAIGLLIVRMAPATRLDHALMVAVAMSILGGAAPLIMPNPFFPDAVRWVHFLEVVTSHIVFGAVVGWLLGGTRARQQQPAARAA